MTKTTMYIRGIRQDLVREAKAMAAREGLTLARLVERALEKETRSSASRPERLSEIAEDLTWYEANRGTLLQRYEGEYLAIVERRVVDHDPDPEALAARVSEQYGARSVYIPRCERTPRVVDVRSPRLVG